MPREGRAEPCCVSQLHHNTSGHIAPILNVPLKNTIPRLTEAAQGVHGVDNSWWETQTFFLQRLAESLGTQER